MHTDGAKSMPRAQAGVISKIRKENTDCSSQSVLYTRALAMKCN